MPAGLNQSSAHQVFDLLCLVMALGSVAQLAFLLTVRRQAGATLLDLGRIYEPRLSHMLVAGGLYLLIGIASLLTGGYFYGIAFAMLGVNQCVMARQRFLFAQAGILARGFFGARLFRWDDIVAYDLGPGGSLSVKLRGKNFAVTRGRITLGQRPEAEALLAARCAHRQEPVGA